MRKRRRGEEREGGGGEGSERWEKAIREVGKERESVRHREKARECGEEG